MPDLNSLPPSRSSSTSRVILPTANNGTSASPPSPSSHSPHSLAATAAINAGARNTERRRSSARMNINLGETGLPTAAPAIEGVGGGAGSISPGLRSVAIPPLGSSQSHDRHRRASDRERAPSLGELHQELESEQEGQVNRLLFMIRQQQTQIQQLQLSQGSSSAAASSSQHAAVAIDDGTPTSERSVSLSHPSSVTPAPGLTPSSSLPRPRSPFASSHRSSRNNSPLMRPTSGGGGAGHEASDSRSSADFTLGQPASRERDDVAFYTAETQMLGRENAMLRMRIRELERQLGEVQHLATAAPLPAAPAAGSSSLADARATGTAAMTTATGTRTEDAEVKDT